VHRDRKKKRKREEASFFAEAKKEDPLPRGAAKTCHVCCYKHIINHFAAPRGRAFSFFASAKKESSSVALSFSFFVSISVHPLFSILCASVVNFFFLISKT
jgi:hypothetical protein